jgi:pyrroloquinoline quinone biosynthesis protein B
MRVRLLGTAAGGAFPQWNCACATCRAVRERRQATLRPRSQCCVAVSADEKRWFLLNASPDLRAQIESFPPLWPPAGKVRGTPIEGVLLTNGDLDKVLGLWLIREGGRIPVHATARVRESLELGLKLPSALECYGGLDWREPPVELAPLLDSAGQPSGLSVAAFPVPSKPPRYLEGKVSPSPGDGIGYRIVDDRSGARLVFVPDLAAIDETVGKQLASCDTLLIDGTFWTDDEMARHGTGGRPAKAMAHLPVSGPRGSLAVLAALAAPRKIFVHINNTNPMLNGESTEASEVARAGVSIGEDGQELSL